MRDLNYVSILNIISFLIGMHIYYSNLITLKEEIKESSKKEDYNFSNFEEAINITRLGNYSIWNQTQTDKVVFIVLDGIRFDLVDGSKINSQNKFNLQLQIFQKLIK